MPPTVDPQLAARFASDLLPGEKLVWTGQPSRRKWFYPEDILAFLFLTPFLAMAGFFFWSGFLRDGIVFAGVFSAILIALVSYFLFDRYRSRGRRRRRTVYGLTGRRVLVLSEDKDRKLQTAFLDRIRSLQWKAGFRGIGTVSFGGASGGVNLNAMMGTSGLDPWFGGRPTAFADIDDPGPVHALVMSLRQA